MSLRGKGQAHTTPQRTKNENLTTRCALPRGGAPRALPCPCQAHTTPQCAKNKNLTTRFSWAERPEHCLVPKGQGPGTHNPTTHKKRKLNNQVCTSAGRSAQSIALPLRGKVITPCSSTSGTTRAHFGSELSKNKCHCKRNISGLTLAVLDLLVPRCHLVRHQRARERPSSRNNSNAIYGNIRKITLQTCRPKVLECWISAIRQQHHRTWSLEESGDLLELHWELLRRTLFKHLSLYKLYMKTFFGFYRSDEVLCIFF